MEQVNLKKVMEYERILPEDFDGVFRFTNDTNEDFIGKWGNKEYIYPAHSTSPMVMPEFSALEIQQIRKKFAKDLAEREFFKTPQYEKLRLREGPIDDMGMITPRGQGMSHAGTYDENVLVGFIQSCLKPLPLGRATVQKAATIPLEEKLSKDDNGDLNTIAVEKDLDNDTIARQRKSLRKKAIGE